MPETDARAISNRRKRRGVVRASITRLGTRLKEHEDKVEEPTTHDLAKRLAAKLETLDAKFKAHHFSLIDLINDERTLGKEQETLDQHDDDVTALAVRIQQVNMISSATPTNLDQHKPLSHKLQHLDKNLSLVSETIKTLSSRPEDVCPLQQHEESYLTIRKILLTFGIACYPWSSQRVMNSWYYTLLLKNASSIVPSRSSSYCDPTLMLMNLHLHLDLRTPTARE